MGKRLRSIGIQFNSSDVRVTRHAVNRFRSRVQALPPKVVILAIREMLKTAKPVVALQNTATDRIYLAHETCILVLTRNSVVVTVLQPDCPQVVASLKTRRAVVKRKHNGRSGKRNRRKR